MGIVVEAEVITPALVAAMLASLPFLAPSPELIVRLQSLHLSLVSRASR